MWPYTQDEATWLARPTEGEEPERIQRAIEQRWLKQIGVSQKPANDEFPRGDRQ